MVELLSGLQWKKFDLHIHTPGSLEDRVNKSVGPTDIIARAQELQLDAICVSDHNTGSWVDKCKEAAKPTGIIVYPGVEITAQGGKRNVHILGIFDPSKGTTHVNDLLSKLNINEGKRGHTDVLAEGDVNQIINAIYAHGGIPILAHADSQCGVMKEMKGIGRIEIVRNPNLLGVHITKDDTAKFLDGSDADYGRKLATFKASDAHSVDEIGKETTYFKMGAMTIDALRQCFYDPDIRITYEQIIPAEYPRIVSIEFSQGFLGGQNCQFHDCLNSIIGGKGVGKSLIIEFLRFALNQPSSIAAISDDMYGKLINQLGTGGTITAVVQTQTGAKFRIIREYDGIGDPITIDNIIEDSAYEGDVHRLFPVLFYSQNEIIDIARDRSAQLKLIDKLIDIESHNLAIEDLRSKLRINANKYVESLRSRQEASDLKREIETVQHEVEELDHILSDPMFNLKKQWEHRQSVLESLFTKARDLESATQYFIESHRDLDLLALSEDDQDEADIMASRSLIKEASDKLIDNIDAALNKFRAAMQKTRIHQNNFQQKLVKWQEEYEQFVKTVGGQKPSLARKRTQRNNYLQDLKERHAQLQAKVDGFQSIEEQRLKLLDLLDNALDVRYQARATIYKSLTEMSQGKLRLTIEPRADRTTYADALVDLAHGTHIRKESLYSLANSMSPRQFVDYAVRRRISDLTGDDQLTIESATKLVEGILADEWKTEVCLALPFEKIPEDVPRIEFEKEDQKYYPLNELSVGQKCTALLLIALSEGTMPIIVDQPEDAIDVATVYYDVVSRLRDRKEHRQFILTTHNPNIAVSSDTDKYHVLKATEDTGQIVCCGAMDLEDVKKAVLGHLEGGIDPYTLRGKKYGLM